MVKINFKKRAFLTFSVRISVRREASDGVDRDKGIAEAIAEERSLSR